MPIVYNGALDMRSRIVFVTDHGNVPVDTVTTTVKTDGILGWTQVTEATLTGFTGTVSKIEVYIEDELVSIHSIAARGFDFHMIPADQLKVTSDFSITDERGRFSVGE